jgi:hypothetical protein
MADVDLKLATALKQAKTTPMFFVVVSKGADGKLLVDRKKIGAKEAAEAKKDCGGGIVYMGRCKGEEGKLIFEMGKEAPATLTALTKKLIKQTAGLTLDVEYRVAADLAAEESQGEPPGDGTSPGKPSHGAADWKKAHAEIEPAYLQGLRDHPDTASTLRAVMGFAQAKAEKQDYTGAIATLQKLREALGKTATPSAGKPPPTADGSAAAEFKAKLAEWSPMLKAAMTAKGPNAAAITKLLAQATALSKPGGDMAQALAKLTEAHGLASTDAAPRVDPATDFKAKLAEWSPMLKAAMLAKGPNAAAITKLLAQATALSKPGGDIVQALAKLTEAHGLAAADTAPRADPAAEFRAKVAAWTPALKAAMAAKGPNAAAIAKLLAQATALSKLGGDMAQALAKLTEAHALAAGPALQAGSPTPGIEKGIVEKRKFLLTRWKQLPNEIASDLEALLKIVAVQHPNLTNLPELRTVIEKQLQALYDELQDEIDGAINRGDSTVLKGLRERVLKHEFVNHLMSNPFVSGSKFQTSILNALQEVEQRLAG